MANPNELPNDPVAPSAENAQRKEVRRSVLRRVAGRDVPTFVEQVRGPDGKPRLLVIERLARSAAITDEEAASYVQDARAVATLQHANIVKGRAVSVRQDEIVVASDFVEGESLSELMRTLAAGGGALPIDIAVRILVDVLAGLDALHGFSDPTARPVRLIHGEVSAANVLVGLDGVSRLMHTARIRRPGKVSTADAGSVAPEAVARAATDRRTDVFSVGVLLWQVLSGVHTLTDAAGADRVDKIRAGKLEPAVSPKDAPWAAPLVNIAARAMALSPDGRYPSAAAMSADLCSVAGARLPTVPQVAAFVKTHAGAKIEAQRKHPPPLDSATVPATAEAKPATAPEAVRPAPAKPDAPKPVGFPPAKPVNPKPAVAPTGPAAKPASASPAQPGTQPATPKPARVAPAQEPKPAPPSAPKPPAAQPALPAAPKPAPAAAQPVPVAPKPAQPFAPKPAPAQPTALAAPKPPPAARATPAMSALLPTAATSKPEPPATNKQPPPAPKAPATAATQVAAAKPQPPTTGAERAKPAAEIAPKAPAIRTEPKGPAAPFAKPAATKDRPQAPAAPVASPPAERAAKPPARPDTKARTFASKTPTLPPAAKVDGPPANGDVLEIDSADAESIPPSEPPSSESRPTFPRFTPAAPVGVMPPVAERPVPVEPKVLIDGEHRHAATDEGEDIDITEEPPSSRGVAMPRIASLPAALPPAGAAAGARQRQRVDALAPAAITPASAIESAEAHEEARAHAVVVYPSILTGASTNRSAPRKPRRGRTWVGVVAGICLVIAGLAGYRMWQEQHQAVAVATNPTWSPPAAPPVAGPVAAAAPNAGTTANAAATPQPPTRAVAEPAPSPVPSSSSSLLPSPVPSAVSTPVPSHVSSPPPSPPPQAAQPPVVDVAPARPAEPEAEPPATGTVRAPAVPAARGPRPPVPESPPNAPPAPRPKFDPKRI